MIAKNALSQLDIILKQITSNKKLRSFQQNIKNGNYWRKRSYHDGLINWNMSFDLIDRYVRALSYPYSGAEFLISNRRYKIIKLTKLKKNINSEPGKIINYTKNSFDVACFDFIIRVNKFTPKIDMSKYDYI